MAAVLFPIDTDHIDKVNKLFIYPLKVEIPIKGLTAKGADCYMKLSVDVEKLTTKSLLVLLPPILHLFDTRKLVVLICN